MENRFKIVSDPKGLSAPRFSVKPYSYGFIGGRRSWLELTEGELSSK